MGPHNLLRRVYESTDFEGVDPGSGGTINVDRWMCIIPLVSAGAESRTLRRPTKLGQLVKLNGVAVAGNITVTVTGGYNEAGSTSIVITAAGQFVELEAYHASATVLEWRYKSSDGATVTGPTISAGTFTTLGVGGDLTVSAGGNLVFTGTTGQSEVNLTDNLADALSVNISGGNDFIVIDTTDSNEKLYLVPGTGQKLSFFNVTPVVRQSAYTQTYATATKTHSNLTAAALTVTDGAGTNDGTIGAITADASVIAAVQELAAQINKLVVDVTNAKGVLNSVIDDGQAYGLLA